MNLNKKLYLAILLFILIAPFVCSNGIKVYPSTISITNKTMGYDENVVILISNQEPYTFYNISFEPNDYISISKIESLNSGVNISVNAIVKANQDINTNLRMKGYYMSNIGQQNRQFYVNVTSLDIGGINPCDFTIVKGDTVNFFNDAYNIIDLKQYPEGTPVASISRGTQFSKTFDSPTQFKYAFYVGGFKLPQTCTLTVLDSTGNVNDPNLDGLVNLIVDVSFEPTNISVNLVQNNYTIRVLQSQDGVLSITNTGNKVAKGIYLTGEWFAFSSNNFDLDVGQTKGVVYTITPQSTLEINSTNKTFTKPLTIRGNFATYTTNFIINVEYLSGGSSGNATADMNALLNIFCKQYPKSSFCDPEPEKVYINGSYEDLGSNVTITNAQFRDLWLELYKQAEERTTLYNFMKENVDTITKANNINADTLSKLDATVTQTKQAQEDSVKQILIVSIIFFFIVMAVIIFVLVRVKKAQQEQEYLKRW